MRFRFLGGLDCPDWILAQIAEFSRLSPAELNRWCVVIAERLSFNRCEWTDENLHELAGKEPNKIEVRSLKAMISALSFIIEKAAKNRCTSDNLCAEMLQLGFSDEHAKQLSTVYANEREALTRTLTKNFIRGSWMKKELLIDGVHTSTPSFSVLSQSEESVRAVSGTNNDADGGGASVTASLPTPNVVKLQVLTSEGDALNFAIDPRKLALLRQGMTEALRSLEDIGGRRS